MTHAATIIAWHLDGAIYCADCKPRATAEEWERAGGPVFASDAEESNGSTCDACHACLVDGEWLDHEEATGDGVRWSTCTACNAQQPHATRAVTGGTYRDVRRACWQGRHRCTSCGKLGTTRFEA